MPIKKFSNILFVGLLCDGSTSLGRLDGLKTMGNEVDSLDTSDWLPSGSRILRSIVARTYTHSSVWRINHKIRSLISRKKYDLVWIEKGEWIYPWTLSWIKKKGCSLINYNTDDILGGHGFFWLHRLGIKNYDLYLTTNRKNVIDIGQKYDIRTMRVGMGFDSTVHHPVNNLKAKIYDIVFIGHWEPHTEEYILELRRAGINVHVWGYNWWKAKDENLRAVISLPQVRYTETIAAAKIALCSLSRFNWNESTGRSFEIPAIGTMLLAEYTQEHEYIYGDGKGAVLFSNISELVKKAKHYLENETERINIAALGNEISKNPGYSWVDHISRELPIVLNLLNHLNIKLTETEDRPFWSGFRNGELPSNTKNMINVTLLLSPLLMVLPV